MRKFYYLLLMLFAGVTATAFAGESGPHTWDGKNKTLTLKLDTAVTFSYTAAERGVLYIYSDNQGSGDNVPLTIEGGWYHDGAYVEDSPLQDVGDYENGLGFYGWIKVMDGDEVRFTISTPKEADGTQTRFTMKSAFFNESVGGDSWEKPVELVLGKETKIPVYSSEGSDILAGLWISNATFCKFTAPSDGVATILTGEYLIYVLEEENIGSLENPFRPVPQDAATNDHEFIVRGGVDYIVVVPNTHPASLTLKMSDKGVGQSAKFPFEITGFPATLDLVKGNNYYAFSQELVGDNHILEVAVAEGWNGTVTYMEDPTEASTELVADEVVGVAVCFVKNVDARYLSGNQVIVNFNMSDKSSLEAAATLTLRAPKSGESFSTAMPASYGENIINGPAGDYWFAHTAEADAVYSFATSGTIKHVNFVAGVEQKLADNVYRVNEGTTIYVCVTTTEENGTFTVSGEEIVDGDYCDRPVYFELGQDINIKGRGVNNYQSFTAEGDGFAIFQSTNWTLHFREECGGRRLNPELTVVDGDDIEYTYKLAVAAGKSYIVETETVSEDITITTRFEGATVGDVCATAIAITALGEKINLDYEFEVIKWFKYTADKDGFYTVKAKLGYVGNLSTKLGDCDAAENNAGGDTSMSNYYMGGYQSAKIYLVEGQTLYIHTKTGRSNDEKEFGAEFYLSLAYAGEARLGEDVAVAIQAEANKEYTILKNDADGYEQWYTYTIPAGEEATIEFLYTPKTKYTANNLSLLKEDMTSMSRWDGDFTQENLTNEKGEVYGKTMEITIADQPRKIYIKVGTANAKFYAEPVVWQIICKGDNSIIVEEVADEAPVIYDLMGRRVENPTKGIYIINGVKRIIK